MVDKLATYRSKRSASRTPDPATNHLAVHTEDHPLEYAAFAGEIPKGEYGGGRVGIWDRGSRAGGGCVRTSRRPRSSGRVDVRES